MQLWTTLIMQWLDLRTHSWGGKAQGTRGGHNRVRGGVKGHTQHVISSISPQLLYVFTAYRVTNTTLEQEAILSAGTSV